MLFSSLNSYKLYCIFAFVIIVRMSSLISCFSCGWKVVWFWDGVYVFIVYELRVDKMGEDDIGNVELNTC